MKKKREIWESTETGAQSEAGFEESPPEFIEMDLEGELMYHLIERLSPSDDDEWEEREF